MRKLLFIFSLISSVTLVAQELNCTITIDAEQTGQPNQQVFRSLQSQLTDFVNNTNWTDQVYKNQERIDCSMQLIITQYDGDSFAGSLQIQSSRPIFDSTYDSPVYNYNDRDVSFIYKEFEPLAFNANVFSSNLVSVLAYHIYTIIGLDADTFSPSGGEQYFNTAKQIVNTAASGSFKGWQSTDGNQSRFRYNDAMISPVYKEFHEALYLYHRKGLDRLTINPKESKNNIIESIKKLKDINDRRPNSFLLRTFFDAKSDEIQSIFSDGPAVDIAQLVDNLNKIAPTKRPNWSAIKI